MKLERQELHCHNCDQYVQFSLDVETDGAHVLKCPNCGHEHCRMVRKGIITDERWDRRNGPAIPVYDISYSATSITMNYVMSNNASAAVYLLDAWANTTGTGASNITAC